MLNTFANNAMKLNLLYGTKYTPQLTAQFLLKQTPALSIIFFTVQNLTYNCVKYLCKYYKGTKYLTASLSTA